MLILLTWILDVDLTSSYFDILLLVFLKNQSQILKKKKKKEGCILQSVTVRQHTYFVSIPRLSINLMTSVIHTAVVEKYRSPDEMVLVYRSATVYVAATSVITVRQYSLKTTLTFSEERRRWNAARGQKESFS